MVCRSLFPTSPPAKVLRLSRLRHVRFLEHFSDGGHRRWTLSNRRRRPWLLLLIAGCTAVLGGVILTCMSLIFDEISLAKVGHLILPDFDAILRILIDVGHSYMSNRIFLQPWARPSCIHFTSAQPSSALGQATACCSKDVGYGLCTGASRSGWCSWYKHVDQYLVP